MLTTTARRWQLLALVLAVAATIFALTLSTSNALAGRPVAWTSWAMPLLILGNAALLWSGWWRTRRRLANVLGVISIVAAVAILIAEVRTIWPAAT
jgi:hypothetical protein